MKRNGKPKSSGSGSKTGPRIPVASGKASLDTLIDAAIDMPAETTATDLASHVSAASLEVAPATGKPAGSERRPTPLRGADDGQPSKPVRSTRRSPTKPATLPVSPPVAPVAAEAAPQSAEAPIDRQPEHQAAAMASDLETLIPDPVEVAQNLGHLIEYTGKAAAAYLKPRETGEVSTPGGDEIVHTLNSLGKVAESWIANPTRMIQAQLALSTQLFSLWSDSVARATGKEPAHPVPRAKDRRFASPEWQSAPVFDFLHRAYLATTDWAKSMVDDAEGVDGETREKAAFYLRQISSALSPSNFLLTNPELLKETFAEKGENLVRGMKMLAEDIAAGKGEVKIRQSDASKFTLGVDMAATPGKVVFRNDLMELLHYAPTTETVLKRPLLIVPPWINKFYVLDLNPEKSFIRWAVSQGLTLFVISWVNPDERHATMDWDAYMQHGILAALDAIEAATDEREVATVGYCVGGTLLAATLAYMADEGDTRVTSSTFLTTQVDFKEAGDLKVFADEAQIRVVEQQMRQGGYLAGSKMANAFNMLRPDDLIWSYAVNTYLRGKAPSAFDLLAWNADATRMSAANHAFYLRNCYLENNLTKGEMVLGGRKLDLRSVTIPIYDLAAKEDHIAPARSVFTGAKHFGGPVRYVLAGSGHIAGVVNPPAKAKYQHWTEGRMDGSFEDWLASATEIKGTWWVDWLAWLKAQAPETAPPRVPGEGGLVALGDAPGDYVRVQA